MSQLRQLRQMKQQPAATNQVSSISLQQIPTTTDAKEQSRQAAIARMGQTRN